MIACAQIFNCIGRGLQLKARTNYSWVNYIMASYKGVCGYVKSKGGPAIPAPVGLNIHVEGQVPQGKLPESSRICSCFGDLLTPS